MLKLELGLSFGFDLVLVFRLNIFLGIPLGLWLELCLDFSLLISGRAG